MTCRPPCRPLALAFALFALLASLPAFAGGAPAQLRRRFVVAVGSNDGRPGRPLKHAVSDARAFAEVLRDLGGVRASDAWLLENPGQEQLRSTIATAAQRVNDSRRDVPAAELVFYFSGHSDESGVWLGGQRVPYAALRAALRTVPADFRIAVLDSCASGSFTRTKGGERVPAFLADASATVRGEVALTSSAEREPSQESDRLGSSYFTHHLLSGLRGAADVSRDGKVTLDEAYRYAFDQTLAGTEGTTAGGQHPAYEMALSGSGEVVMTDLRSSAATLSVDGAVAGRLFVRGDRGRLVVEVDKHAGAPVELGLAPGSYRVTVANGPRWSSATVQAVAGGRVQLQPAQLQEVEAEENPVRGLEQQEEGGVESPAPGPAPLHWGLMVTPLYFLDASASRLEFELEGRVTLGMEANPSVHPELQRFLAHPHELSIHTVSLRPTELSGTLYVLPSTGISVSMICDTVFPRGFAVGLNQYFGPTLRVEASYLAYPGTVLDNPEWDVVIGFPAGGMWTRLWSAEGRVTVAQEDRYRFGLAAGFDRDSALFLESDGVSTVRSDFDWFRVGVTADAFFQTWLWGHLEASAAWADSVRGTTGSFLQGALSARLEWTLTSWLSLAGVLHTGYGRFPFIAFGDSALAPYISPTGSVRLRF